MGATPIVGPDFTLSPHVDLFCRARVRCVMAGAGRCGPVRQFQRANLREKVTAMPESPDSAAKAVPPSAHPHGDTGTRFPPRYDGPKLLSEALTQLTRGEETFTRDGPRPDVEYRDLGWAAATGGAIGAKHI